nr:TSUP family transporter [Akkermansiaceae bacterium]
MDFELSAVEWTLAIAAALAVGISKTGFSGIGLIAVLLMADLFGKPSVGILLPMLVLADISVYPLFRKFASWGPVWKLLPPTLLGCTAGYFILDWIPKEWARAAIGSIILFMVGMQLFRRFAQEWFEGMAHSRTAGLGAGFAAGIATMVANAAGPVFQLYLLSRRFEKMDLIGVGARFFLFINTLKLPFLGGMGFING